ncbi:uncharacterized protein LOC112680369 [Sipha flava]|uniref:Uncharacterized protein LOC112680369 n=1 Tax=Sipha flava TaxID=143950 RepID=A0A8B8F7C9_9HEMI|nr:uncharacterized protein LOC112680369 [Sipha flava]
MTCEYIPDPRGKRHIWHEPKVIKQAMFPIQKGNSIRSVSKTTGIPYSVLQCYYKKYKTNNNVVVNKIGGQTTLPISPPYTMGFFDGFGSRRIKSAGKSAHVW